MKAILNRFNFNYFFTIPAEAQIVWFWFGFFVLSLCLTGALYLYFNSKSKTVKPYKNYAKNFFWPNLLITLTGIVLTLSRYEKLAMLSWRFWVYVDLLFLIFFNGWYLMVKRNQLEDEIIRFHDAKRKEKWLRK
jgi:hypothetical protein